MLFTSEGSVGLTDFYTGRIVNLVATLPEGADTEAFLAGLTETAASATWPTRWRRTTPVEPTKIVELLRFLSVKLPAHLNPGFDQLCDALESTITGIETTID